MPNGSFPPRSPGGQGILLRVADIPFHEVIADISVLHRSAHVAHIPVNLSLRIIHRIEPGILFSYPVEVGKPPPL